ncbi:hypothetical protein [Roseivirga pacifica]|uniref:leucine-rich repeat domain-containing protein n=1 Tax=Roseivirga pacifica TaxID=1267423 RepID=UPI003BA99211
MTKSKFIYAFVALLFSFPTLAQEVDTEADPYVGQAEGMVQTLSYYFNLLGAEKTSLAEREIIINNSYKKLFLNEKVQVEDDLQDDRSTVIYKDVQAYLKDIDFFFTEAAFGFEIEKIERLIKEDETPYYKVELLRNLKGASVAGDSINSTKKRYIEFNFDKNDELKIASIYTNKVSRDKQLREWWNGLTLEWRNIFQDKIGVYFDSLSNVELLSVVSIDSLDLSGNDLIRDIDPIYQLTELKYLKLSDTFVSDLKPLLSINKLQSLDLSQSAVEDLEYLKYHTDIRSLNLSSSPIDTFDVLAAFGKLQKLRLDGAAQVNLQFVNSLKSIEWLSLADGQGLDSINFQQLRNLKYLDVSGSDLDSIAPLQRIEELNISDTGIKDLEFLRGATALKVLYLNNTEVSSLDAISALNSLERVYANGTRLDDAAIASFAAKNDALLVTNAAQLKEWWNGMPMNLRNALREYVSSSPTPEELSQLIRAEALDLTNINLIDITPLSRFQNLKSLTLDKNPVVNLPKSALSAELEKLSINETKVRDLNPLGDHPNLKVIYAKNTLVRNVEVLAGMPALAELDVDNTNVEEATVAALLDKKEQVKVRFMTEQLETWWAGVSQELKDKLLQTINKSGRVNSDDLHALVASKRLEFVGSGFNRQATTAIKRFYRLEELKVQRAGLSGLQLLPVIDELKSLELLEMPIADLSTLQQRYPKLERLVLTNTAVDDLRPLEGLITLQELNFSGTNVKRMRGLEALTELRYIDCSNTSVFRLDRLSELKKLERITCFNTGLRQNDIDKLLEYLPDLEVVYY